MDNQELETKLDAAGLRILWELIVSYVNSRSIGGNIDIDNIINLLPLYSINGRVVDSTASVTITVGKDIAVGQTLAFKYKANTGYSYHITYTDGSFGTGSKPKVMLSAEYTNTFLIESTISSISITGATFIYVMPPQKEAQDIIYDDTVTQLSATNTQEAIEKLDNKFKADYIVEQGATGNWYYRKWNSGNVECWGAISFTSVTGKNTATVMLPFAFNSTAFYVQALPARNGSLVTEYGDYNAGGNIEHTTNSFAFNYNSTGAYGIGFNFEVKGRWK